MDIQLQEEVQASFEIARISKLAANKMYPDPHQSHNYRQFD